jgi:hypothetical protein
VQGDLEDVNELEPQQLGSFRNGLLRLTPSLILLRAAPPEADKPACLGYHHPGPARAIAAVKAQRPWWWHIGHHSGAYRPSPRILRTPDAMDPREPVLAQRDGLESPFDR